MTTKDHAAIILDALYDEAHMALNPAGDDCWNCGGEGETYDCIDGCCADAESGCELCSRPCPECISFAASIERHVRLAILRMLDIDVAIAWLERKGRATSVEVDSVEDRRLVLANLHAGRCADKTLSDDERAVSACWVEGLL